MAGIAGKGEFTFGGWTGQVSYSLTRTQRAIMGTLQGFDVRAALSPGGQALGRLVLADGRQLDLFVRRADSNGTAHVLASGDFIQPG